MIIERLQLLLYIFDVLKNDVVKKIVKNAEKKNKNCVKTKSVVVCVLISIGF